MSLRAINASHNLVTNDINIYLEHPTSFEVVFSESENTAVSVLPFSFLKCIILEVIPSVGLSWWSMFDT